MEHYSYEGDSSRVVKTNNFTGLKIAVVTAAGYPNDPKRYEQRLSGLLNGFRAHNLDESVLNRFYVLGGECNFLFQCIAGANLKV